MENTKKRDLKHAEKQNEAETSQKIKESETNIEKKYRMAVNFNVYAGDDTGLIKKVKMMYNYQTDIIGSSMAKADLSFKQDENENDET
jgi:hypothetical protein